jgi:hypothetical protein
MPSRPMEIHITNLEVKSTTVYSALDFYKALRFWLIENDYVTSKDSDFPEKYCWEARSQNKGKEFWFWWRPKKTIKDNSFFRRVLDIDLHGVGIQDVEIMYQGQKIKAQKGKFEVLIRVKLEVDYGGKWRADGIMSQILPWFYRRLWKRELEMHKRDLVLEAYRFQDFVKRYLKMPMLYQPDQPQFAPQSGYEDEQY